MKNHALLLLKCFTWVLSIMLAFWILERAAETPTAEKGESFVVYTAEKHARGTAVYSVAASADYLFLNHGQDGIISAYDWEGNYCFSIVTTRKGNGFPEVYCVDGILYVIDKNSYVFLYNGSCLLEGYPINSLQQGSELRSWLKKESNRLVSFDGIHVLDSRGTPLLSVPKSSDQSLKKAVLLMIPIVLFFSFIIIWKELVRQGSSSASQLKRRN